LLPECEAPAAAAADIAAADFAAAAAAGAAQSLSKRRRLGGVIRCNTLRANLKNGSEYKKVWLIYKVI
jgi:hypothetical protein